MRSSSRLALIFLLAISCATHRLDLAKTHYQRGLELAGRLDRAQAAAEFKAARSEAQKAAGAGDAGAQAWLVKGEAEVALGQFEDARRSFAEARMSGVGTGQGWERAAILLGMSDVYEQMGMNDDAADLCEVAIAEAKKLDASLFEAACSRWVDLKLGKAVSIDSKLRGKALDALDKKSRDWLADTPTSPTLHYLVSQIEMHQERYEEAWRHGVLARELGLGDEEILRDNDESLLFCYRKLIESGRSEVEARQAAWAKRWGWPEPTRADWMSR